VTRTCLVLGLLAAVAHAKPPTPLEPVGWLVDGQWESKARLPGGREIETRTLWDWGPGRYSLRGRIYVRKGDGEFLQYESVVFWNTPKARLEHVTFALHGSVTRGTGRIEGGKLVLEQPAKQFPAMRSVYERSKEEGDRYVGTNYWKQGDGWREVMKATCERKPRKARKAVETKAVHAGRLEPLRRAIGTWSVMFTREGEFEDRVRTVEPSLHGGLLVDDWSGKLAGVETRFGWTWTYWDPEQRTLRVFSIDSRGRPVEAEIEVARDRILRRWAEDRREVESWKSDKAYEARLEVRSGDEWRESTPQVRARRRTVPPR
jgi:hypothetical protein